MAVVTVGVAARIFLELVPLNVIWRQVIGAEILESKLEPDLFIDLKGLQLW